MAFRFSLSAVLKYRENIEQREYLALERVHQEIGRVEAQVRQIEQWCQAEAQRREAELSRGIPSVHLQSAVEQELELIRHRDLLHGRLRELHLKRKQHLKTYEQARQKREILEELRSRQLSTYERDQAKRQQNAVDDIFLARYGREK